MLPEPEAPHSVRPALILSAAEADQAHALCSAIAPDYASSDDVDLLRATALLAHRLPERVVRLLTAARFDDDFGSVLIRGYKVDDAKLGATPPEAKEAASVQRSLELEILTLLHGGLLGDPFGWETQQKGHLVTDIVPVRALASAQVGGGSTVELMWHTEDAFHPSRADYLVLTCLRNPDVVATSIATVDDALAEIEDIQPLFRPCVVIRADDAHLAGLDVGGSPSRAHLPHPAWLQPKPTAILSGSVTRPRLCIDPAYMDVTTGDPVAAAAVADLCTAIDSSLMDVALQAGDVLIVNNRRAVHGRRTFEARYDGTDRWLKRVNVARAFSSATAGDRHPRVIV